MGDGSVREVRPSAGLAVVNEMLDALSFSSLSLEEQRRAVEADADLPSGASIEAVELGGVPCEWIAAPGSSTRNILVSVRGGGYCLGSLRSNRRFSSLLSEVTSARALNVGYRNAPEDPHPAALDDVVRAYRSLLGAGADPARVAFVGNSAGGGLVLAALLALRDAGDRLPACAAVISPWTDLACTGATLDTNAATERMLDPAGIDATAALYAAADQLRHPYVSPLYGDSTGLPPLLVHASGAEILLDDARRYVESARRAGVDVTFDVVPDVPHVWHLFAGILPEADDSLVELGVWLLDRLP